MKFISKNANLRVVLTPGVPGERLTGRLANPGMHVKFEQGVANVEDQKWIDLMLSHPGFKHDYIMAEENISDPYARTRKEIEPDHSIEEIKYGHIEKNLNPKSPIPMSQEQKAIMTSMATEMAKQMVKPMLKELLEEYTKSKKTTETGKSKGPSRKRGRPFAKPISIDEVEKQVKIEEAKEEVASVPEETIN